MRSFPQIHRVLVRALPLLVVACASAGPGRDVPGDLVFLECDQMLGTAHATAEVTDQGDVLRVRGNSLTLPPGAVRGRERFELRSRAGRHVGVDILPRSYQFGSSATITLSWARCGSLPPGFTPVVVEVEHGKARANQVLQSTVNMEDSTVSAQIEHLTGYLIGGT
jgi:hypothetical protein